MVNAVPEALAEGAGGFFVLNFRTADTLTPVRPDLPSSIGTLLVPGVVAFNEKLLVQPDRVLTHVEGMPK